MQVEILTRNAIEQLVTKEVARQMSGLRDQIVDILRQHNITIMGGTLSDTDSVSMLKTSVRLENALRNADITTIGQLTKWSPSELLKFRNFGKTSLSELELRLAFHGRKLK